MLDLARESVFLSCIELPKRGLEFMRAVCVGGARFLGTHVAEMLTDLGYYGVAKGDLRRSPYVLQRQRMFVGDIIDDPFVRCVPVEAGVEYQFAGLGEFDVQMRKPINLIERNLLGTGRILDAPVEVRIKWRRGVPFLPDLTGLPGLIADRLGLPRLLGTPPQP